MMPASSRFGTEFFSRLEEIDAAVAAQVAAAGCGHCGGPLHRGNYLRKPRGGGIALGGEGSVVRHSLCCGRRGCRRRALPPSLRFLGRRVYLEAVVLMASVLALVHASARAAAQMASVPARTVRRWSQWWCEEFAGSPTWTEVRARFAPPPPEASLLPRSLIERFETECQGARDPTEAAVALAAQQLAPATTMSVTDGSRFVRGAFSMSPA